MTGRPSSYTDEVADIICEAIATGAALHRLCRERDDLPAEQTVYRWIENNVGGFREKYTRARERQQDYEADHILEIADTEPDNQRARNMIDARKWRASKLAPKKYGDRTVLAGDAENPVRVEQIRRVVVDPKGQE